MTIGTNDILNTSSELTKDKSAKKTDFTTEDYSTISNQFSSIFSTQFTSHFQNQFDYSSMNKGPKFMANTATSMTENKYYASPSISNTTTSQVNSSPNQYQDTQRQGQESDTKSYTTQPATSSADNSRKSQEAQKEQSKTETSQKSENEQPKQQEVKAETTNQQVAVQQAEAKPTETKKEITASENPKAAKKIEQSSKVATEIIQQNAVATASVKVAVKDEQNQKITDLVGKINEAQAQVAVSQVKDAKIEKLEVKTSKKEQHSAESKADAKKEVITDAKDVIKTDEKTKNTEDIKNKASMERLTANVVEAAPEEQNQLSKLLKKENAKTTTQNRESSESKSPIEFKNPTAFANNQNFEQNFGQNQNNHSQNPLKDNLLKGLMPLDTSMLKTNIQGNIQFDNAIQNSQPKTMMEKNISDQVLNQIKGNISTEKSQVSMVLNPEKLGKVTLNIMNNKGTLSAEIKTETKEAAEALNKSVNELKETLKQQGVVCTNLVVKVEEPNKSENQMNFAQHEHSHQGFEQGNAQNSEGSFQNSTHKETSTAKTEYQRNIQEEEQDQPAQTKATEDNGLVDYRA